METDIIMHMSYFKNEEDGRVMALLGLSSKVINWPIVLNFLFGNKRSYSTISLKRSIRFFTLSFFASFVFCACTKKNTVHPYVPPTQTQPDKEANIFILAGQSNALGQHEVGMALANLPLEYRGAQPNILVWRDGNFDTITAVSGFEPMLVPLNTRDKIYNNPNHIYTNITGWGVEQSWLHYAQTYFNDTVYLLKNAYGALSIAHWDPDTSDMYAQLSEMILNADSTLRGQKKQPVFRGLVWMQGEADVSNTNYYNQLTNFAQHIRSLKSALQTIPFIIIRILPNTIFYSPLVDSAYYKFRSADSLHNFIIDPASVPGVGLPDSIHYDDSSKILLGNKIFDFQRRHSQLK